MRKLLLMLLLCIPVFGFAQNKTVDSLEKVLASAKADTIRSDLYYKIALELQRMDPVQAEKMIGQSMAIAQKTNFQKGIANVYSFKSIQSSYKGEFDSMKVYSEKCIEIAKKVNFPLGVAKGENGLGIFYWQTGNFSEAIKNHLSALAIREKLKDTVGIATSLGNLALVYFDNQNSKEAERNALLSVELAKKVNKSNIVISNLQLLANVYGQDGKFDKALARDAEAFILCKQHNDMRGLSQVYSNMANCYTAMKQYDKGLKYQLEVLKIDEFFGDKKNISDTYMNISAAYADQKEFKPALDWMLKGLKYARESKYKQGEKQGWGALSNIYEQLGDYKNGLAAHQKYQSMSVDLINEKSNQQIALMQTQFDTEKKEQKITLLNKENTIQKLSISKQATTIAIIIGLLIVALVVAGLVYNRNKLKQKAQLQAQMLQHQDTLTKAVIDAEEHERKRIGADLHDGVGQLFSAVKMNLNGLFERINLQRDEDRFLAENTLALVDESCKEVRMISHQMMPSSLLKSGIASDLKKFIEKIDADSLKIKLETTGFKDQLESNVETMLYRIIQETINNVIKHANATQLDITLKRYDNEITAVIKDNGVGFDTTKAGSFEGIGLKNILTRIEYLRGTIDCQSALGMGTTVTVNVPA
ncbi:sensor histidine kinase [Mucilaginibacter sp. RB4R14]|uniref:tetratricopeptide repeat-containing sensor histidine kinase n=1 Tax=Mucilaginibacter aurantiaciroseus TaxID=2949308 RepID=UPI00209126E0|nr:sensor histidine kinase [Mucilaginibacter aurantiaciroseus]MCO5934128.1 sensor histidine kinase [Mucilaginibacter aurantiaciroseus]